VSWAGQEANEAVARSLEEWVAALPAEVAGENQGMIGDWLAIVCMVAVDGEGDPRAEYYLVMKDGTLLPHVAEGLLQIAARKVDEAWDDGGEDE
jgi:hypothetical protein